MTYPISTYSNNGGPFFIFSDKTPASSYPTQSATTPPPQSPSGAISTNVNRSQSATQTYLGAMRIEE